MDTSGSDCTRVVLIVSDDENFRSEALSQLKKLTSNSYTILTRAFDELSQHSESALPSMVLIEVGEQEGKIFSQVESVLAQFPNAKIVGTGRFRNVDLVLELVKLGVKDFLKLPFDPSEVDAMLAQLHRTPVSKIRQKSGRIVTMFSPKGGTGATFLTINVGAVLAEAQEAQIAVCDLAPQAGDIATYLNLNSSYTIRDIIDSAQQLDMSLLQGVMLKHPSGLKVLASAREDQDPLGPECVPQLESAFSLLKQAYDIVLVDIGHADPLVTQHVLKVSDLILLIGNADMPSLKSLVLGLNRLMKLQCDPDKVKVLINRFDSKKRLDTKEFEKKTKHPIAYRLPNDYSVCAQAINDGVPIHEVEKNSELAKKITELAGTIAYECLDTNGVPHNGTVEPQPLESLFAHFKKKVGLPEWHF